MAMVVSGKEVGKGLQQAAAMDSGKYVRYTPEQVEALERVYSECPKPSSLRRQQIIRECPILSNIEPKQIKVWFQNRSFNQLPHDFLHYLPSSCLTIFQDSPVTTRTLDLASTLEVGSGATSRSVNETVSTTYNLRSVLTIAFQFTYENHLRDSVAAMARQYVRSVVTSVQRVAMAIAPSRPGCQIGVKHPPGSPEAHTLARWISRSYRVHTGAELFQVDSQANDSLLKLLWHHSDAIMCCSLKASHGVAPVFTFSNQAGLDMLETTLIALQDITLENILDDNGRKVLCSEFPKIMQQKERSFHRHKRCGAVPSAAINGRDLPCDVMLLRAPCDDVRDVGRHVVDPSSPSLPDKIRPASASRKRHETTAVGRRVPQPAAARPLPLPRESEGPRRPIAANISEKGRERNEGGRDGLLCTDHLHLPIRSDLLSSVGRESRGGALSPSRRCGARRGRLDHDSHRRKPSCSPPPPPPPPPPPESLAARPIRVRETAAGGEHAHDATPPSK
ncbi:hypothetical protein BHE74_00006935 [Ensete ventricosum]|nr:hypothetical protein BHE74_00006935 [Ensete ventricosum]